MKAGRLLRWSGTVQSSRIRPHRSIQQFTPLCRRHQSTATATVETSQDAEFWDAPLLTQPISQQLGEQPAPSPPIEAAAQSAKLSALHARLSLPSRLPIETLARTLVDSSADPSPRFNNRTLSSLGNDLLAYYAAEYILAKYPRLPMAVVYAAMWAYVGPKALATITKEWGVELVAAPGSEVDPGFLQFKRLPRGAEPDKTPAPFIESRSIDGSKGLRRGLSSRSVYDDEFGELRIDDSKDSDPNSEGITSEKASSNFVRALIGAIHLHGGRPVAKQFFKDHFMSRQLNMANLFSFRMPTRDLSRLCAREGFQPPVARLLSETGRRSRHPVFIVGVYSGKEKLGEGAGSSLDEARTRAAISALKGWYLYSPLNPRLPSDVEDSGSETWKPALIDYGEVIP